MNATAGSHCISMLRLGAKTAALQAAGITTVARLAAAAGDDCGALLRIPTVGKSTADTVVERLASVEHVLEADGSVDWAEFAKYSGFPVAPSGATSSGSGFLAAFPEVIRAAVDSAEDPIDRLILTERLTRPRHAQLTLEEIAAEGPRGLTRERVRQREKALLQTLSDAFLFDEYLSLKLHFRADFTGYWQCAAASFGQRTKLTFEEFIAGLVDVWKVSPSELLEHLPLITSVLTSRAQVPASLQPRASTDPRLFGPIAEGVAALPLTRLAVGGARGELEELGITTIAALVDAARWNRLPAGQSRTGRIVDSVLGALAAALGPDGTTDWPVYAARLSLKTLPDHPTRSADDFLASLRDDLEAILAVSPVPRRSAAIFRLRTGQPKASRMTLAEVAEELDTHGPTIKREETIFLAVLNDQLVERDFSSSTIFYRPDYLQFWREADEEFRQSPAGFGFLCARLAGRWNLNAGFVEEHAEALWAVLDGYPNGRRTSKQSPARQPPAKQGTEAGAVIIVLRGFRRSH